MTQTSKRDASPGLAARFARRLRRATRLDRESKNHTTVDGNRIVITCEACGVTSEFERERGRESDNPSVIDGYFVRTCPRCGREQGTMTTPRVF